jgi:type IV pilus assembly protein PilO
MVENINLTEEFDKLKNLNIEDLKRIGSAPNYIKLIILVFSFFVMLIAGGVILVKPVYDNIKTSVLEEKDLKQKYIVFQDKSANLSAYKQQLEELEKSFKVILRQLPDRINIESLLLDLTQTSTATGLQIEEFKPQPEVIEEFYASTAIKLKVNGTFHQFGHFISGLAALPRIVTLDYIQITNPSESSLGKLSMEIKAITYRYIDTKKNNK